MAVVGYPITIQENEASTAARYSHPSAVQMEILSAKLFRLSFLVNMSSESSCMKADEATNDQVHERASRKKLNIHRY